MPLVGIRFKDTYLYEQEVMNEATMYGEACGYPLAFWLTAFHKRDVQGFSVTEIVSETLRQRVLQYHFDYYELPERMWARALGTWIHSGVAHTMMDHDYIHGTTEGFSYLIEHRLTGTVRKGSVPISGQIDLYNKENYTLLDLKTTKRMPKVPYPSHLYQLGAYKWLLEGCGYAVEHVGVVYATSAALTTHYLPIEEGYDEVWNESMVLETLSYGLDVLEEGLGGGYVPSIDLCNKKLCNYCAVKDICWDLPEKGYQL